MIVSSHGSTAESAARNRQAALREAQEGIANADQLHTGFYDRARVATWMRCRPGLISWVKEKVGHVLVGWWPYGPWSGPAEAFTDLTGDRRTASRWLIAPRLFQIPVCR